MKIVSEPIEVVAIFRRKGYPEPVKFRHIQDGMNVKVNVDKVIRVDETGIVGARTLVYVCQSEINGTMKPYELKYNLDKYAWELYKI